jgi:hypothetical protein
MAKRNAKVEEIKGLARGVPDGAIEAVGIEPLKDARFQPFVEHLLSDILMIALIAVMAEADEWIEIGMFAKAKAGWLRTFLPLPNGIPSYDTIQRVMSQIDGTVLYSLTIQFLITRIEMLADTTWMVHLKAETGVDEGEAGPWVVACDGKTSRGSKRNKTDRDAVKAIHTVSAYATDYGLSLAEAVVNEKTNEIPTVRDMLDGANKELIIPIAKLLKKDGKILICEMHSFAYLLEQITEKTETITLNDLILYFEKGPYNYEDGLDYVGKVKYKFIKAKN